MSIFQAVSRGSIRRSIGKNLGILIDGIATAAGADKSSLYDTKNLLGGNDEHNQKEIKIYDAAGAIVNGETSIVSDFVGATHVATCLPIFSAAIAIGDKYEMWKTPWRLADIDDAINQAISEITCLCLQIKEIHSPVTEENKYLYNVLSGFTHLYKVEYVKSIAVDHLLDDCESAFTAGTAVTATADSSFKKVGNYSAKFVVAAGAASGATLCYKDISSVDISDSDKVQFWMYSSIALTAGQLQFMLGATAAIASPLETIDIPAMAAGTWYRHEISLANPHSDTAIISIGIRQASGVDVGAFTFYLDDIHAILDSSNQYKELPIEYWNIAKGSTPALMLSRSGLSIIGSNKQMRLTGFQIPALLTADSSESEIDPGYLINKVCGELLVNHAKSSYLDIHDRLKIGALRLARADAQLSRITTSLPGGSRSVT